ncbi:MAG: hypothetical protein AAGJ81_14400 [Verrucomicrobiota bacterium]
MKKKAVWIALGFGVVFLGALTFRVDYFQRVYPERLGYEKFKRYSVGGIAFFRKKLNESFPYDQEFLSIFDRPLDSVAPVDRRAHYTRTLLGGVHKTFGYGWLSRERREILEAIYLMFRESENLETAKQQVRLMEAVVPLKSEELEVDSMRKIDELRLSVGLEPYIDENY